MSHHHSHGHGHGHHHHPAPGDNGRAFGLAIGLNTAFVAIEFVYGFIANSTALMDDEYKNNAVIFPPAELMAKCEYPRYAGPEITQLLDESLTRLRAD